LGRLDALATRKGVRSVSEVRDDESALCVMGDSGANKARDVSAFPAALNGATTPRPRKNLLNLFDINPIPSILRMLTSAQGMYRRISPSSARRRGRSFALLKQLIAPVYRWPGGSFVSGDDRRDGIGPLDAHVRP
jgi:hypothetical protein